MIILSQLFSVAREVMRVTEYLPGRPANGTTKASSRDEDIPKAQLINHCCADDLNVYRECPVCNKRIHEDHDLMTGKPTTNHYAEHYSALHTGEAIVPTQQKPKDDAAITPQQKAEAREAAVAEATNKGEQTPPESLSERHQAAEETARDKTATTGNGGAPKARAATKTQEKYGADVVERSKLAKEIHPGKSPTGVRDHYRINEAVRAMLKKAKTKPVTAEDLDGISDEQITTLNKELKLGPARIKESLTVWRKQVTPAA